MTPQLLDTRRQADRRGFALIIVFGLLTIFALQYINSELKLYSCKIEYAKMVHLDQVIKEGTQSANPSVEYQLLMVKGKEI